MEVPKTLVPAVRELSAKHERSAGHSPISSNGTTCRCLAPWCPEISNPPS